MATKTEVQTKPARPRGKRKAPAPPRRANVTVRRVSPWSVLKFSLLFYLCLMLVFVFALVILYWALGVIGVLDSFEHALTQLGFGGNGGFQLHGSWILQRVFIVGAIGVVVWSLVNMFLAVLYNLISDIIGGIQVTLTEKR